MNHRNSFKQKLRYFIDYLFEPEHNYLESHIRSIYEQQHTKNNSPNFFYKGNTYITTVGYKCNKLDNSLKTLMNNYLLGLSKYEYNRGKVYSYVLNYAETEILCYNLLPDCCYSILEKCNIQKGVIYEDFPKPKQYADIALIIKEQMLFTVIG